MKDFLKLEKVSIFYNKNMVFYDIDLEVKKGDFVYIVGDTGSGKTTLIRSFYGQVPILKGNASIIGYDLAKLKTSQIPYLRRKLGMVFQDYRLLTDRNIYKNLYFVLKATGWSSKKDINFRINEVLNKVGIGTKHFKIPSELSGGEQQRVAIARALLNDPSIIIADEPTANLDINTARDIIRLFWEINKRGTTVIISTHNQVLISEFPAKVFRCCKCKLFHI